MKTDDINTESGIQVFEELEEEIAQELEEELEEKLESVSDGHSDSKAKAASSGEKNKRVVLNILSGLASEAVIIVFGLLLPRLYLVNFGSDVNGLDSTIKNIFAYLALLEAGVGLSAQYALYRPVAKGDTVRINAILSATRHFYLRSGAVYTAATVLFALVYPLAVKTTLNYFTVSAVVLLYGIPGIISFLLRGKYTALLEVEGKKYILTALSTVTLILSNILRLLFLLFSDNLILIQATYSLPSVLQVVFVIFYTKRHYTWIDWNAKPDLSAFEQKGSVLIHQISNCIFWNTDTLIISVMCGMNYASVYAVYSLFFSNFQKIVPAFSNSLTFKFGQTYHTDPEKFEADFSLYESVYYLFVFLAYTGITAFLTPIIQLYTSGIADSGIYDSKPLLFLFAATTVLSAVEIPLTQIMNIAGTFKETRHQAVLEMVINIAVSILATWRFGVAGCLVGTIAALGYRVTALIFFTSKKVRRKSVFSVCRKLGVNTALSVLVLTLIGTESCQAVSYPYVLFHAALGALWITALFVAVNILFDLKEYKKLFALIKAIGKRKKA